MQHSHIRQSSMSQNKQLNLYKKQVAFIRSWETKTLSTSLLILFFFCKTTILPSPALSSLHTFSTTCKRFKSSAFLFHTTDKSFCTWSPVGITTRTFTLPVQLKVDRKQNIKNSNRRNHREWMKEEKFTALCHVSPVGCRGPSFKSSTLIYKRCLILLQSSQCMLV